MYIFYSSVFHHCIIIFNNFQFQLRRYDTELASYKDRLFEYDISFPPR